MMRNPKDIAVSWYHFYRGLEDLCFDGTWDEFFEMYVQGEVMYGSWFDHVLGWWAHRDDPNILFLKYEDLKKDLVCGVQQIAAFVGKDVSNAMIQQIAGQTSFEAMKDLPQFAFKCFLQENEKFMRKGKIGDWRNYFNEDQSRRFDEDYATKIQGTGLKFEFEAYE